jgi:hypothetical protein
VNPCYIRNCNAWIIGQWPKVIWRNADVFPFSIFNQPRKWLIASAVGFVYWTALSIMSQMKLQSHLMVSI